MATKKIKEVLKKKENFLNNRYLQVIVATIIAVIPLYRFWILMLTYGLKYGGSQGSFIFSSTKGDNSLISLALAILFTALYLLTPTIIWFVFNFKKKFSDVNKIFQILLFIYFATLPFTWWYTQKVAYFIEDTKNNFMYNLNKGN